MLDETNMDEVKKWFYQERARTVVSNLKKRHMHAQYVPNRPEAQGIILDMIQTGATISRGDSVTLHEIGIIPILEQHHANFTDPFARDKQGKLLIDRDELYSRLREAVFADIFLTGTNAVTLDGKLVNIDGAGNRVAPMLWGPKKVIVVAGVNKIVRDVDEAVNRIRHVAAPLNAQRHYQMHQMEGFGNLPCVRTGKCVDCRHKWKICNYTVIIEGTFGPQSEGRISVVLIGEELGL